MAEQTTVQYVGVFTLADLQKVERGVATLATLKWKLRTTHHYRVGSDLRLSRKVAISILEEQQGIEKTPKDLIAQILQYQGDILYIEREPDLYVAPDKARAWYEQQIAHIRQLLAESREETHP
jgi:hypothetical protein